jgi:hypothetical protein
MLGNSECDGCRKTIKKGDMFALMGPYPGYGSRLFWDSIFAPSAGLDRFPDCYLLCEKCFKKKFQGRKKSQKGA